MTANATGLPQLALYVHLPWCVSKCPYCDFNSHALRDDSPRSDYLNALLTDIKHEAKRAGGRKLASVFIGGGTPSLFTPTQIGAVIDSIHRKFSVPADLEITMEANPGTLERGRLRGYRDAGVTRLSLGAQSFSARALTALGRIHSPEDTFAAVSEATDGGFEHINLDIMYGLPEQTLDDALDDVGQACALPIDHVSHYQLTLEPNTQFYFSPPPLPPDDERFEMQWRAQDVLRDAGFQQYEVSAYAKPGARCRHNLNYWQFGDYLAAGAGAHGKVTDTDHAIWRYRKPAHPRAYIAAIASGEPAGEAAQRVTADEVPFEFLLNALRLPGGFAERDFERQTGLPIGQISADLERAQERGLLERLPGGIWCPSELGFRFLNDLQALFLPSNGAPATPPG